MAKSKYEVWCRMCGALMKKRRGKFGAFWGCTGYPRCKNTMSERDAQLEHDQEDEEDMSTYVRWDR